jgi:predicted secreted protein
MLNAASNEVRMGGKVALVSHCLLNVHAKVADSGVDQRRLAPLIDQLSALGYRIVQMPCPEMTFIGARRWWMSYEQYDTPAYRRHCRELATAVTEIVADDLRARREVILLGVDGSPSSGVSTTFRARHWLGRPTGADDGVFAAGPGVWIEELLAHIEACGLPPPALVGIGLDLPDRSAESFVVEFRRCVPAIG